ncbi:MAG TPA: hypothetical protein VFY45_08440 [Baekduia sp.]|nr:hypothetical protein [Baekduia sp.]
MKKLPNKSTLLFGVALAVCAFAAPMASAASWSPLGSNETLFSSNLALTQSIGGGLMLGMSCASSTVATTVTSAAVLRINSVTFANCSGTGIGVGCTVTPTGTNFPWTATAVSTTNIQIHDIRVALRYETKPGGATHCDSAVHNTNATWTGTLTGGSWEPSSTAPNRVLRFTSAPGTVFHGIASQPAFVTGSLRNAGGSMLDVLM